jgi:hypothetical protein
MHQSSTLSIGMDVHKESIAVAYVAQEHHAEVITGERSAMIIDPEPHLRYNHSETDRRENRCKRQQLRWYGRRDSSSA